MKKQFLPLTLLWLLLLGVFTACNDDAGDPVGTRLDNGLLVVNKGNFGQGNGTLSFIPEGSTTAQQALYAEVNGEDIGGIIESVNRHNGNFYIVANVEDKIVVADALTLEKQGELSSTADLTTPRYMVFDGDKAYVSVWGPYTDPATSDYSLKQSKIAVIDLATLQISETIPVPGDPEGLMLLGDKLYVAHTFSDSLSLINTSTNQVVAKVKTARGPSHFITDATGRLWLIHSDPWGSGDGYFVQYNQNTLAEENRVSMAGIAPNGKMQRVGDWVYFSTASALYRINLTAASPTPEVVLEQSNLETFLVDETSGDIFLGVSDSANPGTLIRVNAEGQEVQNFQIGAFPHQILKL